MAVRQAEVDRDGQVAAKLSRGTKLDSREAGEKVELMDNTVRLSMLAGCKS